jgi:hypothetical protein
VESARRSPAQEPASDDGVAFERLLAELSACFVSVSSGS